MKSSFFIHATLNIVIQLGVLKDLDFHVDKECEACEACTDFECTNNDGNILISGNGCYDDFFYLCQNIPSKVKQKIKTNQKDAVYYGDGFLVTLCTDNETMTTKDFCLSFKGKQELSFGKTSNGHYSDFNLNQVNQYSKISSVNSQIAETTSSRNSNNCRANNMLNSWKKSNLGTRDCLNALQDFDGKKDQRKDLNKCSDTITLHIPSYESYLESIGASDSHKQDFDPKIKDSRKETVGSLKKWKNVKEMFTNSSTSFIIQNPFELPRAPKKKKETISKVAQSSASQRLFPDQDDVDSRIETGLVISGKANKYKILNSLASESQSVWSAEEVKSKDIVVIKLFTIKNEPKRLREKEIYEKLAAKKSPSPHFINIIDEGERTHENFLVLPVLDSTVLEKFDLVEGKRDATKLSNFTKIILAKQMLKCLEDLHSIGVTHGDLKYSNFGILNNETVILFDFERSQYVDKGKAIDKAPKASRDRNYDSTYWSASIAYHEGQKLHFKDDLESLCYLLCQLFIRLPWIDGTTIKPDTFKIQKENSFKNGSNVWNALPEGLRDIIKYNKDVKYNERPPYELFYCLIDRFFEPKDIVPILNWNKEFVYHGKLMPPHLSQPYFDYSKQRKHLVLIYNCERWTWNSERWTGCKKRKTVTEFYRDDRDCECILKILGSVDKMYKVEKTLDQYSIAKIYEPKFQCPKHKSEKEYPHICVGNEDHEYFENKGLDKKSSEITEQKEERKQVAAKLQVEIMEKGQLKKKEKPKKQGKPENQADENTVEEFSNA